jgi:hypothetical protein
MMFFSAAFSQHSKQRNVDVVIAMDLSGSTNGLLENFRDKMWDIINQWKMFTPAPTVRIGLIGFSRFSFTDNSGYVKVISDLTDDYDMLSQQMFEIKPYVENGIQFVGAAIGTATTQISWSSGSDALKILYVMGNGEVNLGHFDFRARCEEAAQKGIIINTVYCMKSDKQMRQREYPGWNEIAKLTGGSCYQVLVNKRAPLVTSHINMVALASLNDSLNKTFIPYGKGGAEHLRRMLSADENASKVFEAYFYSRMRYKFSPHYQAQQLAWDIVSYKEAYPESRLAAIRNSQKNKQDIAIDLETLANTSIERRNAIVSTIKTYFPEGEEDRIHNELSSDDYELENRLDKTMIASFYQILTAAGYTH